MTANPVALENLAADVAGTLSGRVYNTVPRMLRKEITKAAGDIAWDVVTERSAMDILQANPALFERAYSSTSDASLQEIVQRVANAAVLEIIQSDIEALYLSTFHKRYLENFCHPYNEALAIFDELEVGKNPKMFYTQGFRAYIDDYRESGGDLMSIYTDFIELRHLIDNDAQRLLTEENRAVFEPRINRCVAEIDDIVSFIDRDPALLKSGIALDRVVAKHTSKA